MGLLLILYQILFFPIGIGILCGLLARGRGRVLREGPRDLAERLGLAPVRAERPIWVHAASVGEVTAAGGLLTALKDRGRAVLVTTTTVAGRQKARALGFEAALAPVDLLPAAHLFLERVRPRALILVETELWPTTLWLAGRRGVPVGIANGCMTESAFSRYRMTGGFFRPLLGAVSRAAVQTERDAGRFAALGVRAQAIAVTGNIKFDLPPPSPERVRRARALLDKLWPGRPRWAAGSTWRDEEEVLIAAHKGLLGLLPGAALILAPRHVERAAEVAATLKKAGLSALRLSELDGGTPTGRRVDCLLVDRLGELGALYGAASAAFVGGTLNPVGGHNLLEPALLGRPVLFGPYTHKAREAASALSGEGGGFAVADGKDLTRALLLFLKDGTAAREAGEKAERAARSLGGATERTLSHLASLFGKV